MCATPFQKQQHTREKKNLHLFLPFRYLGHRHRHIHLSIACRIFTNTASASPHHNLSKPSIRGSFMALSTPSEIVDPSPSTMSVVQFKDVTNPSNVASYLIWNQIDHWSNLGNFISNHILNEWEKEWWRRGEKPCLHIDVHVFSIWLFFFLFSFSSTFPTKQTEWTHWTTPIHLKMFNRCSNDVEIINLKLYIVFPLNRMDRFCSFISFHFLCIFLVLKWIRRSDTKDQRWPKNILNDLFHVYRY